MFSDVLDCLKENNQTVFVRSLLAVYLLNNVETDLKEIIETKHWFEIKQDILSWIQTGKKPSGEAALLPAFPYTEISDCYDYLCQTDHIKLIEVQRLIQNIEEKYPHCKAFFAPWFKARLLFLSECKFDDSESDEGTIKKALALYRKAFDEGRNFAGQYMANFIEEAIATNQYFAGRPIKDIPKVIDQAGQLKTPINNDAKRFYEYGYALNMFDQESAETYFLHFHAAEHFLKVFPFNYFCNMTFCPFLF
ncbi:hypothetical protein FACS189476_11340 [Spirochaetia bacterium]|nr:hypothetical protein FACS189476_11340 [Spirochaetia bacterium]